MPASKAGMSSPFLAAQYHRPAPKRHAEGGPPFGRNERPHRVLVPEARDEPSPAIHRWDGQVRTMSLVPEGRLSGDSSRRSPAFIRPAGTKGISVTPASPALPRWATLMLSLRDSDLPYGLGKPPQTFESAAAPSGAPASSLRHPQRRLPSSPRRDCEGNARQEPKWRGLW